MYLIIYVERILKSHDGRDRRDSKRHKEIHKKRNKNLFILEFTKITSFETLFCEEVRAKNIKKAHKIGIKWTH